MPKCSPWSRRDWLDKIGTQGSFLFFLIIFYCYSITAVPISPPLPSPTHPTHPTVNSQGPFLIGLNPKTLQQHSRASQTNNYAVNLDVCIRRIIQSPFHLRRLDCPRLDKSAEFPTEYWASLQLCNRQKKKVKQTGPSFISMSQRQTHITTKWSAVIIQTGKSHYQHFTVR